MLQTINNQAGPVFNEGSMIASCSQILFDLIRKVKDAVIGLLGIFSSCLLFANSICNLKNINPSRPNEEQYNQQEERLRDLSERFRQQQQRIQILQDEMRHMQGHLEDLGRQEQELLQRFREQVINLEEQAHQLQQDVQILLEEAWKRLSEYED